MSQPPLNYQSPQRSRQILPVSGIPLFRLFGIQVYLHWMWFLAVVYLVGMQRDGSESLLWSIAEVLALFAIVLAHEFGHALACRSVGGQAERIVLWPLGGVAFVNPPRRPGAVLWSIAAGPLVNVILIPITLGLVILSGAHDQLRESIHGSQTLVGVSSLQVFLIKLAWMNGILLFFNILPIYPLDGGQILQAILWFFVGEGRSLMIASIIGLVGSAAGLLLALATSDIWLIMIALFAAMQSFAAIQRSRAMRAAQQPTMRQNARCPACGMSPPVGNFWTCPVCSKMFDIFENRGNCPSCRTFFPVIPCPHCRQSFPPAVWFANPAVPPVAPGHPA